MPRQRTLVSVLACWIAMVVTGVLLASGVSAQSVSLRVLPEAPRALQPTYVRIGLPGCEAVSAVRHVGGEFALDVVGTLCGVPPAGPFYSEVSLGELPQGEYRVRAYDAGTPGRPPLTAAVSFTVAPPTRGLFSDEYDPLVNYSGTWWNPDRNGEGWFVDHAVPDRLILVWTTYDADQRPIWLWMYAKQRSYGKLRGSVYRSTGAPPQVGATIVGEGEFVAQGSPFIAISNRAVFSFTPTGQSTQLIELERVGF